MRSIFFFAFIITSICTSAQVSGVPASTKWKQIETDTARIIFTNGAELQAQQIADLIHKEAKLNPYHSGKLKKINVVLHGRTTLANGYVGLAPFRSEYYLVPGSDIFDFGNLPWQNNLAVHEYRHVQQFNSFRHGFGSIMNFLFGESGLAVASALVAPDWFFEGDAVYAETQLTGYGRGRRPMFLNDFKSLWQEGINYSWMKLRNGSYKDLVPNHYPLGYLLVNYGYEKYGKDFWPKLIDDAGSMHPGFIKAIEKNSNISFKKFRNDAFAFYKESILDTVKKQQQPKTVTSYYYPQQLRDGSVVSLKKSYKTLPAFVITNGTREEKIALRNISTEDWFHYHNNKIVYTAYSTNARRDLVDYSDIVVLDINSKQQAWLTNKQKYYTPSFSPGGDKILAVAFTDSLTNELRMLDASTGSVQKTIASKGDYYIQPRFIDEDNIITGIRNNEGQISLQVIGLRDNKREILIPFTIHTVGSPVILNDTLYFTASFKGNDDLYAMTLKNHRLFQLTSTQTGNYYASINNGKINWSYFTAHGYNLEQQAINSLLWKPVDAKILQQEYDYQVAQPMTNAFKTPGRTFETKPYKKSTGFFNYHSWFPEVSDPEYGITLRGDNVLNTFSNEIFYRYNVNELSHTVGANVIYGALFPVITAGGEYTFNRNLKRPTETITMNQSEGNVGLSLPLNFSRGKMYKFLNLGSSFHFTNVNPTGASVSKLKSTSDTYLQHNLNWQHYLPEAIQHLLPKFGYTLNIEDKRLLSKHGYQFNSTGQLFLPGFMKTHGIQLTAGLQQTDTGNLIFSNRFSNARGYEDYYFSKMWKLGVNYHLPLFYPDWGFADAIYFKRFRSTVFYDHSTVYSKDRTQSRNFRSTGAELIADLRLVNTLDASIGVRYSHLLDNEIPATGRRNRWEIVIPINPFSY